MFSYDIELFKSSLEKVEISFESLTKKVGDMVSINSISELYEGADEAKNSCRTLEKIISTIQELSSDMSVTLKEMNNSLDNDDDIFASILFYDKLSVETIEILNKIKSFQTYDDFYNLFKDYNKTDKEMISLSGAIEDILYSDNPKAEDYEKILLAVIYYQEKEYLNELKGKATFANNRIIELESILYDSNSEEAKDFNFSLQEYENELKEFRNDPNTIKNLSILIDDELLSFATYEEGMNFIKTIKAQKMEELEKLKLEQAEYASKIDDYGSVILKSDSNGAIIFSPNNMTFQELLENTNLSEIEVYDKVLGNQSYKTELMNFFNDNRNPLGEIGCDQGIFKKMTFEDPEYIRLKNKLINEYGFSKTDATKCFQMVDSIGACSYAAVADNIIIELKNNPELAKDFEDSLGISLYTPEGDLNTAELLLDLFIYANDKENGGDYFYQENGKYHVFEDIQIDAPEITVGRENNADFNNRNYIRLTNSSGADSLTITDYLKQINSNLYCMNYIHNMNKYEDNPKYDNYLVYKAQKIIIPLIESSTPLILGMNAYGHPGTVDLLPYGNANNILSTPESSPNSGHVVNVVGYNSEEIIVDTWGGFYKVSWEDAVSNFVTMASVEIGGMQNN